MSGRLLVDLDLLLETVEALEHCERDVDEGLDDVVRRVRRLHESWSGRAAEAQAGAQARWEAGFAQMREGLATMRTAASTARANYGAAVEANLRMWSL
ncbi:hypothetical protein GCM10023340_15940 [Nocardioides marinquilinus]|uniref:WXG100 family type VII secretion target n=1 Tax=Nocardioides marinquilinus TaxID=1210400 RepID=A0ABP9PFR4_9ACTN